MQSAMQKNEKQDGEDRKTPLEADDDRVPPSKNRGKDQIAPKQQEIDDKKGRIPSDNKESKDLISLYKKKRIKRGTSKKLYTKVCALDGTDKITLFNERNYKVAITIGLDSSRMCLVGCLLGTADGPNLLRKSMVIRDCMSSIRVCEKPQLGIVTNKKVEVVGIILLYVCMREVHV